MGRGGSSSAAVGGGGPLVVRGLCGVRGGLGLLDELADGPVGGRGHDEELRGEDERGHGQVRQEEEPPGAEGAPARLVREPVAQEDGAAGVERRRSAAPGSGPSAAGRRC